MGDEKGKNYCSLGIAVFCKIGVIEMCKPFLFIPKKMFTKMIKYHLSIIITIAKFIYAYIYIYIHISDN